MLECYFESRSRLRQLRRGPLGPHIDGLASWLRHAGYTKLAARHILNQASGLSLFAHAVGITSASAIEPELIERFYREVVLDDMAITRAKRGMHHVLEHLRREGLIATEKPVEPAETPDLFDVRLSKYDAYLRDVRGLQAVTRAGYQRAARRFLKWYAKNHPNWALSCLSRAEVLEFITSTFADECGLWMRRHLCSQTRIFLRYLGGEGLAALDLDRAIPKTRRWKLSSVPRHLPWEQVRALIDSVDTTNPWGVRDKAVLLLLATLGLRSSEILSLKLSHINWRAGELRLPRTKSSKERILPMPQEVGATLADYVLHSRPTVDVPFVFLRHKAPVGPLTTKGSVTAIVRYRLKQAGIEAPSYGPHMLRHSLATRMVNVGVPIKTIADVLGHASIDTTAIYTKVDVTRLASAAMPFPGGGAA